MGTRRTVHGRCSERHRTLLRSHVLGQDSLTRPPLPGVQASGKAGPQGEEKTGVWPAGQFLPNLTREKGSQFLSSWKCWVNTGSALIFSLVWRGLGESSGRRGWGPASAWCVARGSAGSILLEATQKPAGHLNPCHGIWGASLHTVKWRITSGKEKQATITTSSYRPELCSSRQAQFRSQPRKQACPGSVSSGHSALPGQAQELMFVLPRRSWALGGLLTVILAYPHPHTTHLRLNWHPSNHGERIQISGSRGNADHSVQVSLPCIEGRWSYWIRAPPLWPHPIYSPP